MYQAILDDDVSTVSKLFPSQNPYLTYYQIVFAITHNKINSATYLISQISKVENLNSYLTYAASVGRPEIVKILLDYGADNYDLVAHYAVQHNHLSVLNLVIDKITKATDLLYEAILADKHVIMLRLLQTQNYSPEIRTEISKFLKI